MEFLKILELYIIHIEKYGDDDNFIVDLIN